MVLVLAGSAIVGIAISVILGFLMLFYVFPHHLVELGLAFQRYKAGMKMKYVRNGNMEICYGEKNSFRDDKPTLVFLHGFTSSCNQWIVTFKNIQTDHHMIALDLPGHGRSSIPSKEDISLDYMIKSITDFLDSVDLKNKKIHLIGTSLGGAMSGIFASCHPDRVEKVSMICPAMGTPVETEFTIELRKMFEMNSDDISHRHCRLLPQDIQSMREMFKYCTFNKTKMDLPNQIFQGILNLRMRKNDYFLSLLKYMNTEENLKLLAQSAPSITMPSQIIWGEHDEIISSSGAEYLKSHLPDCRHFTILDRSGHCIDLDRPYALCKALCSFITEDLKKEE